jgi:hypothetical protein
MTQCGLRHPWSSARAVCAGSTSDLGTTIRTLMRLVVYNDETVIAISEPKPRSLNLFCLLRTYI